MKLGRLPRKFDTRIPKMDALIFGATLPPIPTEIDYTSGMPANLGVMLNDTLCCCTCSAIFHAIQVWTFNAQGVMDTEPDAQVQALYSDACGYVPGNASTDQGGDEQSVLNYLLNTGAPISEGGTQKIAAYVEVDPSKLDDLRRTIYDCGVAYIGFNVPNFLMNGLTAAGSIWDVDPSGDNTIAGGHAVILAGYLSNGNFKVISWGNVYEMTPAFVAQFVDEAYAIADPDWLEATGSAPCGLSISDLEAQMQALKFAQ